MGGGEWRPSQGGSAQRQVIATFRITLPGATAPTQPDNAAQCGAACGAARAAGSHSKFRAHHTRRPEKARRVLARCGGKTHQLRPAVRHQHCRALVTISRAGSACPNTTRDPARLMRSHPAIAARHCPALTSANERARTSPRTKQTSDTRHPPRPSKARTDRAVRENDATEVRWTKRKVPSLFVNTAKFCFWRCSRTRNKRKTPPKMTKHRQVLSSFAYLSVNTPISGVHEQKMSVNTPKNGGGFREHKLH